MNKPERATGAPEVSVIIPTKDRPELLKRALATALAQTGIAFEVIVVDDGSTPQATVPPAEPRIRVIRHPRATGVAEARNDGIAAARGRWVAFLDDDDLWAPEKLSTQVAAMREHGGRWSYTGTVWLTGGLHERWTSVPTERWVAAAGLVEANAVGTPSGVVAERQLVLDAGGFDARFSTFADWDLWLRMADRHPVLFVPGILTGYVTHEGSMHRGSLHDLVEELHLLRRRHRARGRIGGFEFWYWVANSQRDNRQPGRAVMTFTAAAVRWQRPGAALVAAKTAVRAVIPKYTLKPSPRTWVAIWHDSGNR